MKDVATLLFFLLFASAKAQINKRTASPYEDTTVYKVSNVDSVPMYPGGEDQFYKYLSKNIVYPTHDLEARIEGRVLLSLIIGKDGTVTNITVLRSPSPGMSAEAISVINNSPKWKPAILNSKPVRVKLVFPLSFVIPTNEDPVAIQANMPTLAAFPGGTEKFYKYLHKNTTLTKITTDKGITIVSFEVEKNGSTSKARIEQSVSPALDEEAIRLILNSPKWDRGIFNGKRSNFRLRLKIDFWYIVNMK